MSFRFQADADLNPEIGRGLLRRRTDDRFSRCCRCYPRRHNLDPEVLQIAAEAGRVLVSRGCHDDAGPL